METMTKTEAMIAGGLNWTVSARPIYDNNGREIEGHKAITRDDTNEIFNIVSDRYVPFQNETIFDVIDRFTKTGQAKYCNARAFNNGAQVVGRVAVPDGDFEVLTGDKCKTFLQFSTSHDGAGSIRIEPLVYRMVCQNGLHRWEKDAIRRISVRHTASAAERIQFNAEHVLSREIEYFKTFAERMRALAAKEFNVLQLESFLYRLFDVKEGQAMSARAKNQAYAITRFVRAGTGQDIPGVQNTAWGVYNGVTEYVTHAKGNVDSNARQFSEYYGSGRDMREKALDLLENEEFAIVRR